MKIDLAFQPIFSNVLFKLMGMKIRTAYNIVFSILGEEFKLKNLVGKGNDVESISMFYFLHELHKNILTDQTMQDFLRDPNENFDVAIIEWFYFDLVAG